MRARGRSEAGTGQTEGEGRLTRCYTGCSLYGMATRKKRTSGPGGVNHMPQLQIRADREQIEHWRSVAAASGRTLSGWIRWVLDGEARASERRTGTG